MTRGTCSFALRAVVVLPLLLASAASTGFAIGVPGGTEGPKTTLTFQPVVWEPYIPELYVEPRAGGEGHEKSILKMEKPAGELPGVRPAWKALKERFNFDNLAEQNEATKEIISGWKRSQTGFLVHATSEVIPNGDAKIVQQLIAEAPALFYGAVRIDFGEKTVKADREAYLLEKYFKAVELKITAHEIQTSGTEFKLEDIRGISTREPFLPIFTFEAEFSRPWTEIGGDLTSSGRVDKELPPWRVERLVELRLALEVEGRLDDAEEPVRKKAQGAIRFIVLPQKAVTIDKLSGGSERKFEGPTPK